SLLPRHRRRARRARAAVRRRVVRWISLARRGARAPSRVPRTRARRPRQVARGGRPPHAADDRGRGPDRSLRSAGAEARLALRRAVRGVAFTWAENPDRDALPRTRGGSSAIRTWGAAASRSANPPSLPAGRRR